MGQSRGGYSKKTAVTPQQKAFGNKALNMAGGQLDQGAIQNNPLYQQAIQGIQGFLPGGQGFNPITQAANQNFQQQTLPAIMNAFGSNAKTSSALNQALAQGGANLNTNLAAQQAQMMLQAAGLGSQVAEQPFNQGLQLANLGLNQQQFAFAPRGTPLWQDLLIAGVQAAGKGAGAAMGGGG